MNEYMDGYEMLQRPELLEFLAGKTLADFEPDVRRMVHSATFMPWVGVTEGNTGRKIAISLERINDNLDDAKTGQVIHELWHTVTPTRPW